MKKIVEIEWDLPEDGNWLCSENIEIALKAYCTNTNFKVTTLEPSTDSITLPTPRYIISFTGVAMGNTVKSNIEYRGTITDLDSLVADLKKNIKLEACGNAHPERLYIGNIFKIED